MDYRTTQDVTDLGAARAKIRRAQKAEAMVREAAAKLERQPSKLVGKPYVEVEAEPPQPLHSEAELDRAEQAALRDIAAKLRKVESVAGRMRSAIVAEKRAANLAALEQACNQAAERLAKEPSQLPSHELPYTEIADGIIPVFPD